MKKSTDEKAPPAKALYAIILFTLMLSTFLSGSVFAQVPAAFNYQAVARNAGGDIISNTTIGVQFQLHQATSGGTVVYAETQSPTTNAWGLFSVQVGNGTPSIGTLSAVDWKVGPFYLEVGLDPAGGSSYISMGTEQLLSVPYSLASGGNGSWQANSTNIHNTNSGRIGIGTATPGMVSNTTAKIEIADEDGLNSDLLIRTAGGDASAITLAKQNGTLTAPLAVDPDAGVGIIDAMYYNGSSYGTSSRISMQADGATNGTDYPGAINIQTTPAGSTIPLTRLMVTGSGFVGIGTISPLKPLDVNGDALINGLTIGRGNNGNDYSTALGFEALIDSDGTTATATGSGALSDNGVGSNNTATGKDALNKPKYSIYTAGSANTAIGSSALANFRFEKNTAAGSNALFQNTMGQYNTALGSDALFNNTGILNTAVGTRALYSSAGSFNTALGYEAGYSLSDGEANLAIGSEALKLNISGSSNTAVGFQALNNDTSGYSNTAIGYMARTTSASLTNATAIGYNAQVGVSNALILGGTGLYGVNVGIGTSTPSGSAKLDVSSTNQGFLPPRMTDAERDAIPSPVAGLVIFNTSSNSLDVYNGYTWRTTKGTAASIAPDNSADTLVIGDPYQGGIVAYILQPGDPFYDPNITRGIIAAPQDQSDGIVWGCDNQSFFGKVTLGLGRSNTITIAGICNDISYATKICYELQLNGYDDWHLPSKEEMDKMFLNRVAIGGFSTNQNIANYWTSSEPTITEVMNDIRKEQEESQGWFGPYINAAINAAEFASDAYTYVWEDLEGDIINVANDPYSSVAPYFSMMWHLVPLSSCTPFDFTADGTPVSDSQNFDWVGCGLDVVSLGLKAKLKYYKHTIGPLAPIFPNYRKVENVKKAFTTGKRLYIAGKTVRSVNSYGGTINSTDFARAFFTNMVDGVTRYSTKSTSARVRAVRYFNWSTEDPCSDGFQNGEETGVDCGGPYCQPCICHDNYLRVSITLDDHPEETSWVITNTATGLAVATSNGNCGSFAPSDLIYDHLCLEDGDYWFVMLDAQGNGLNNGSYIVDNGSCRTYAAGGAFGWSDTTFFSLNKTLGSCYDGIQNGNEECVDCGGSYCDPCPGCNDGILNGEEELVDCGGPDCIPCHCYDYIQNFGETGVDCGGPCQSCESRCSDGIKNGDENGDGEMGEPGGDCGGSSCVDCSCSDGIQNYNEILIDCGGTACGTTCDLQRVLDLGQTPWDIVQAGYPVSDLYGLMYRGGIICYYEPSGGGLLAAPMDQGISTPWGCSGQNIIGASGVAINAGQVNTDSIVSQCMDAEFAARLCQDLFLNGRNDWYLPSIEELNAMWANLADSDGDGQSLGPADPNNLGGFYSSGYWSSTQVSATNAWARSFINGAQDNTIDKSTPLFVRAVRAFCYNCCDDGIQNGIETGVDCGGLCVDCATMCSDGVINGDETGIDCGGSFCTSCSNLCSNSIQDGDETGIDCGGSCQPCVQLCGDGVQNGDETGIDCGGSCVPCAAFCSNGIQDGDETGIDCGGSCVDCSFYCNDGVQNGDEAGVDCGGPSCEPCIDLCNNGIRDSDEAGVDCGGTFCVDCLTLCGNDTLDGNEVVIADCGGSCGGNPVGLGIDFGNLPDLVNWTIYELPGNTPIESGVGTFGDSTIMYCLPDGHYRLIFNDGNCLSNAICGSAINEIILFALDTVMWYMPGFTGTSDTVEFIMPMGNCSDGIRNGSETGVDCGGVYCVDCASLCNDGIQNGDETWIDCGGASCVDCIAACSDGIMNANETGVDCGDFTACQTCGERCIDGIQNGDETDIDCGGISCVPCDYYCNDGIQNGYETGIDCGGPYCLSCECNDGILNNDEEMIDCGGSCAPCMYQDLLDAGQTAWQLYQAGAPLDSLYGLRYQGGLIFYLDISDGSGMIAAPVGQGLTEWGCTGADIPTQTALGDGVQNTVNIASNCAELGIAAKLCADLGLNGSTDWYLPSKDELAMMHANLHLNGKGGFSGTTYWSSTEFNGNDNYVWAQNFGSGGLIEGYFKGDAHQVRAVRSFCVDCCTDQVQNGTETGIDCGGSCQSCINLCNDGFLNGDETSVDCGGSCGTCTVQYRLDSGETPYEVYLSDNSLLDSLYGKAYQGGIICHFEQGTGDGWVVAPSDLPAAKWIDGACYGQNQGGDGSGIDQSVNNTNNITLACGTPNCAAKICANLVLDGYSNWYLPSENLMDQIWWNLADSDHDDINYGPSDPNNLGGIANGMYWTSTEYGITVAKSGWMGSSTIDYNAGGIYESDKQNVYLIRPVRPFQAYATCSDGAQNGDETGVDCGGSCPTPCITCSDGIQNGDETGIDCGGTSCVPCHCYDGYQSGNETGTDCGGSCMPCSIQQRLNEGETPFQIYQSDNSLLSSLYGMIYQGGLIAYLNTTNGAGFVAAASDQSTAAQWGCDGTLIPGADGWAIGTGAQNTVDIVAGCPTPGIAADVCANLTLNTYSDWFLPSIEELNQMYLNLHLNGFGALANDFYWSSAEQNIGAAVLQNFNDGVWGYGVKFAAYHVRAIRSF